MIDKAETIFHSLQEVVATNEIQGKWSQLAERIFAIASPELHPEDIKLTKKAQEMLMGATEGNKGFGVREEKEKGGVLGLEYSDKKSGDRLILRIPGEREGTAVADAYWLLYHPGKKEGDNGSGAITLSVLFYPDRIKSKEIVRGYLELSTSTLFTGATEYVQRTYEFNHN